MWLPNYMCFVVVCLWLMMKTDLIDGRRILAVLPSPLHSHQSAFRPLLLELHKRGHELVVITPSPLNDKTMNNYTEIHVRQLHDLLGRIPSADLFIRTTSSTRILNLMIVMNYIMEEFYKEPVVKKFYAPENNENFDLVITDNMFGLNLYPFGYRFKAPVIGIAPCDLHEYEYFTFGTPPLISHPANFDLYETTGTNLTLWQRIKNFFQYWFYVYFNQSCINDSDKLVKRHLGADTPHVREIAKNVSLILVNYHLVIHYAKPMLPNIITFSGIHIEKTPPPLPNDLQEFADNSKNGFIYMSLGTTVKYSYLRKSFVNDIATVFSFLPYNVLWKCDGNKDDYNIKANNVIVSEWFPQQSILAHPNIKVFIFQGGGQSSEEAIHYGVPIVGIPFIFDQGYRVQKLQSLGVGRSIDVYNFDKNVFRDAIYDVIQNKSYKSNMMKISALCKDQPYDSLDNMVWWVEYVMRWKGVPHLRFSGVNEPWYQKYDMDIVAFLAISLFMAGVLVAIALSCYILPWTRKLLSTMLFSLNCYSPIKSEIKKVN